MILDKQALDGTIIKVLDIFIDEIEEVFNTKSIQTNIISYTGDIDTGFIDKFREFIELVAERKKEVLTVILNTPGGSASAVEKMVEIIRYHYKTVHFIVPSFAMSAGTIFCMSGDKIYMDYSSSLGPIDPQVLNKDKNRFVPALGYLDKVNELIEKSNSNQLSNAEFVMLQSLDLAELREYEQAKELSIDLLKKWLVQYKFKDWSAHKTNNVGATVSQQEKENRAEEIAASLSDNTRWHSHGRFIGIETLKSLKLEIEDYTTDKILRSAIIQYSDLLNGFVSKQNRRIFLHANLQEGDKNENS